MIRVRKSGERGHFDHGWLKTYHTFSFADYYDPEHMHFRALRVMNEDFVTPGQGFGTHGHQNMEIVTCVLEGTLEHKDSLGTGSLIRPGELQRMSAGTGVMHSEFNPSATEAVHLYQIWLLPDRKGLPPSYEQKVFSPEARRGKWQLVASPDGRAGSLTIHQDAEIYLATLQPGEELSHSLKKDRYAWVQVMRGNAVLNGVNLAASDGAALSEEAGIAVQSAGGCELMVFDLA